VHLKPITKVPLIFTVTLSDLVMPVASCKGSSRSGWAFGSRFGFGSVPLVIDEIRFQENGNRSVPKKIQELSISVLGYFGSIPVLTELTEFFQKTSRQQ
jgi:hypothetical protein